MAKKKASGDEIKTEAEMIKALRRHFCGPSYALLTGVTNGTGRNNTNEADAIAMSIWPSRGLYLIGIEIKVSRSDWLRELKNPAKAESIARYCDQWCIAAGSESIVQISELPKPWGLLVPGPGGNLKVAKAPAQIRAKAIDKRFLAAVFRRVVEQFVSRSEVFALRAQMREEVIESVKAGHESDLNDQRFRIEKLEERNRELSQLLGYNLGHIASRASLNASQIVNDLAGLESYSSLLCKINTCLVHTRSAQENLPEITQGLERLRLLVNSLSEMKHGPTTAQMDPSGQVSDAD